MSAYKKDGDETSLGYLMDEFRSKVGVGLCEEWTIPTNAARMTLDNQISATLPFPTEVTVRTGPPAHMPRPSHLAPPDQTIRTPSLKVDTEDSEVPMRRRRSPSMLPVPFGMGAEAQDLIRTKVARPPDPGAELHDDDEGYVEEGSTDRYVPLPSDPLDEGQPTPEPLEADPEAELPADDGLVLEYYQAVDTASRRNIHTDSVAPINVGATGRHRSISNVLFSIGLGVAVGLSLALVGAAFLLLIYH